MTDKKQKVLNFDEVKYNNEKKIIQNRMELITSKIKILDDYGSTYSDEDLKDIFTAGFQYKERFYNKQYGDVRIKRVRDLALDDLKKSMGEILRYNVFSPSENPELNYIDFKDGKPVAMQNLEEVLKAKYTIVLKGEKAIRIHDKIQGMAADLNELFELIKPISVDQWTFLFRVKEQRIISNPDIEYSRFNEENC